MDRKRIIILISALIVSALIVWHDLPLEFPGTMFKVVMLFVKLFIVIALASFAYIFTGGKKKSS
jgi:hypothetical protein